MTRNTWTVDSVLSKLCVRYKDYLDNLPRVEHDVRVSADVAWCLLYTTESFERLPFYWRQVCGTLMNGLRQNRVCHYLKSRSTEVDDFCRALIEWLWEKHTRKRIAMDMWGNLSWSRVSAQQCYDQLWTMWGELVD